MFDTRPHWLALQRNWRMQAAVALILPVILVWFLGDWDGAYQDAAVPLFVLALLSMFLTLWRFRHYKHALIEAEAQGQSEQAEAAWHRLHHQQLLGLVNAKLPGWIGMLLYVCSAEIVPLILLALASQCVMLLYRPPSAWVNAA